MVILELCDGMNLKAIKIKTERIVSIQREDLHENTLHILFIVADPMGKQVNIRRRS
jgi:hypothetical protein